MRHNCKIDATMLSYIADQGKVRAVQFLHNKCSPPAFSPYSFNSFFIAKMCSFSLHQAIVTLHAAVNAHADAKPAPQNQGNRSSIQEPSRDQTSPNEQNRSEFRKSSGWRLLKANWVAEFLQFIGTRFCSMAGSYPAMKSYNQPCPLSRKGRSGNRFLNLFFHLILSLLLRALILRAP